MTRARDVLVDPANALSLVRIPLAGVLWLRPDDAVFLLSIVAIAAVSDGLDGIIGRRLRRDSGASDVGSWLDPVCDKIFAVSAVVAVVVVWDAPGIVLPLLLVRDVLTAVLAAIFYAVDPGAFVSHDFHARVLGKATTVLQVMTIVAVVLWPVAVLPLAGLTAVVGAAAVVDRWLVALRERRAKQPVTTTA